MAAVNGSCATWQCPSFSRSLFHGILSAPDSIYVLIRIQSERRPAFFIMMCEFSKDAEAEAIIQQRFYNPLMWPESHRCKFK